MDRQNGGREPLFPVEGAVWARNNKQVWADSLTTAQQVHRTLTSNGYQLTAAVMLSEGIYKFTFYDHKGQNYDRASGDNAFVDLMVRLLDFSSLMFEVAYLLGDMKWRVFRDGQVGAWYGNHNAELPAHRCREAHPCAEIVIRPTLFPDGVA